MVDVGIRNLSEKKKKIALNGYVLHVDFALVKEIVSLQRDYTALWGHLSELLEKPEVVAL